MTSCGYADLCEQIGVASPAVYAVVAAHSLLRRLPELLKDRSDFVIKPNRGSATAAASLSS